MQRLWWLFLTDRTNFNIKILVYIGAEMIDLAKTWKDLTTTSLDQAMTRVGLAKAKVGLAKARVGLPMTRAGLAKTRVGLSKARVWEQCFLDEVCCLAFLLLSQHPSGSSLVRKDKITHVIKGVIMFYNIIKSESKLCYNYELFLWSQDCLKRTNWVLKEIGWTVTHLLSQLKQWTLEIVCFGCHPALGNLIEK